MAAQEVIGDRESVWPRKEPHSVRSAMFIAKRAARSRTPSGVPCL